MKNFQRARRSRQSERGQILPMLAIWIPLLFLFAGMAIDGGFAYVTRATLSKAVDAAALAAMRNVNQGQTTAQIIGHSAFDLNYGLSGRDAIPPVVNVAVTTDANNNTVANVSATATINTFFIRILPQFKTLNVSASAQATRPQVIMSLVLDRSGSMNLNGGAQSLPPAVNSFLGNFDDNNDRVAMVSFSSIATVDVAMRTGFKNPIAIAVNSMVFGGATYAEGGLLDGQTQINSVATQAGQNVVKVAVFFTDGWANTNEDSLNCPPNTKINYGGCAPPEAAVGWCSGISFMDANTGKARSCGASQFPSQLTGGMQSLTQANISNDAMYRAVQLAKAMRAQGIVIYSIGLGDKISEPFLQQLANDPASSTFDSSQPIGQAAFAPTAADLQGVFQTIASKILLRLSQ